MTLNNKKTKEKVKSLSALVLILVSIYIAVHYCEECAQGIKNAITLCTLVLIPSLFVFLIISTLAANNRICGILEKIFGTIFSKIFLLPKSCAPPILLSLIGGYPIGAKTTIAMYENKIITKSQAQKLCMIAVCSGPSFVINYVGVALFNSKYTGFVLLTSQIVAFFLNGIIIGRIIKADEVINTKNKADTKALSFTEAIYSSTKSMINICATVVFFCAIVSVIKSIFANTPAIYYLLCSFLEVTSGVNIVYEKYPLYVLSAIIGFGSLSVHFQIFSIINRLKIKKQLFFLFRILQGILAGLSTYILLILFNREVEVFSTVKSTTASMNSSVFGAIALIMVAVCFVCSINNQKIYRR